MSSKYSEFLKTLENNERIKNTPLSDNLSGVSYREYVGGAGDGAIEGFKAAASKAGAGAAAEQRLSTEILSDAGLGKSGYASFIGGAIKEQKEADIENAFESALQTQNESYSGYREFVADSNEKISDAINDANTAATEYATKYNKALYHIINNNMSEDDARTYASLSQGFEGDDLEKLVTAAKENYAANELKKEKERIEAEQDKAMTAFMEAVTDPLKKYDSFDKYVDAYRKTGASSDADAYSGVYKALKENGYDVNEIGILMVGNTLWPELSLGINIMSDNNDWSSLDSILVAAQLNDAQKTAIITMLLNEYPGYKKLIEESMKQPRRTPPLGKERPTVSFK